jgi:hypothetical protein
VAQEIKGGIKSGPGDLISDVGSQERTADCPCQVLFALHKLQLIPFLLASIIQPPPPPPEVNTPQSARRDQTTEEHNLGPTIMAAYMCTH